jgi:hypothetical protein
MFHGHPKGLSRLIFPESPGLTLSLPETVRYSTLFSREKHRLAAVKVGTEEKRGLDEKSA